MISKTESEMLTTASTETEEKEETEVLDFNKPDFEFIPKGNHLWRQEGPYLCCRSCDCEHAVWIGMDKMMIGLGKDGQPILKLKSFGKV